MPIFAAHCDMLGTIPNGEAGTAAANAEGCPCFACDDGPMWVAGPGPGRGRGDCDTDGTTAKREAEEQLESEDGEGVRRNGTEGTTCAGARALLTVGEEATEMGEDWGASPKMSGYS